VQSDGVYTLGATESNAADCATDADGFKALTCYSAQQWAKTLDVAGNQRMLSQKMAKEFLLVALGHSRRLASASDASPRRRDPVSTVSNKAKTLATVEAFDEHLHWLTDGEPSHDLVIASPTVEVKAAFDAVKSMWPTVKALYLDNIDTVRDVSGTVNQYVLGEIMVQRQPSHSKC
jgi:hypothetical protein